jgi:hypothetical protein
MKYSALFVFTISLAAFIKPLDQDDFRGTITYKYTRVNREGNTVHFPQEMETLHISSTKILVKIISGQIKYVLRYDLLLDLSTNRRFEIYHENKTIHELPEERVRNVNFEYAESDSATHQVLKMACTQVSFKRVDVHSGDVINYFNEKFKKKNLKSFAILQGNANTYFWMGDLKGYL